MHCPELHKDKETSGQRILEQPAPLRSSPLAVSRLAFNITDPSVNKWAAVSKCNTIDFVRSFRGRGEKKSRRKMEFSRAGRKMLNVVDGYAMVTQVFGRRRQPRGRKEGRK